MDQETREALEGSIRKWEAIVAGTGVDKGSVNCPLCQKFCAGRYRSDACIGCPVRERTGRSYCEETPYVRYVEAEEALAYYPGMSAAMRAKWADQREKAAKEELEFLRSLRPDLEQIERRVFAGLSGEAVVSYGSVTGRVRTTTCLWSQQEQDGDCWSTSCGQEFVVNSGSPSDNKFCFCCYCGKRIEECAWSGEEEKC